MPYVENHRISTMLFKKIFSSFFALLCAIAARFPQIHSPYNYDYLLFSISVIFEKLPLTKLPAEDDQQREV